MKITVFAKAITEVEGKKVQVNVAQVMEVLRTINALTSGMFYKLIRSL